MACNGCSKPYSLLRKEKGCPGCGFGYCSGCLSNKVYLPKLNTETKVCLKCKQNLNVTKVVVPPDAYFKRVQSAANSNLTTGKLTTGETSQMTNDIDQQILERLNKLKEGNVCEGSVDDINNRLKQLKGSPASSTDTEITSRLARLRGFDANVVKKETLVTPTPKRTEQEQTDALMKEYLEQVDVEARYKNDFDEKIMSIEARLNKIKEEQPVRKLSKSNSDEDEESMVKKLINKYKAEASLEDDVDKQSNQELPFCEICNEDATMRCLGCRYLFCKRCFVEHKDDDDECNKYELYSQPKQNI